MTDMLVIIVIVAGNLFCSEVLVNVTAFLEFLSRYLFIYLCIKILQLRVISLLVYEIQCLFLFIYLFTYIIVCKTVSERPNRGQITDLFFGQGAGIPTYPLVGLGGKSGNYFILKVGLLGRALGTRRERRTRTAAQRWN